MMWGYPGFMGFGAGGGWIVMGLMVLFWIAVIVGVISLVRHFTSRPGADRPSGQWTSSAGWDHHQLAQSGSSALRILEERYARGEIDQEDFLKRRADLTHRP